MEDKAAVVESLTTASWPVQAIRVSKLRSETTVHLLLRQIELRCRIVVIMGRAGLCAYRRAGHPAHLLTVGDRR